MSSFLHIILGFVLYFLCFLVASHVALVFCVLLESTLNFPNVDQRPGFLVASVQFPRGCWCLGNSCSTASELFVVVTFCAALSGMKTCLTGLLILRPLKKDKKRCSRTRSCRNISRDRAGGRTRDEIPTHTRVYRFLPEFEPTTYC